VTGPGPDILVATRARSAETLRPYPHQTAAWDALSRDFGGGVEAGLLVLPTGAGKTFVAARWLLANHVREGGRVLWLAHRRSLLRQAARTFLAHADAAHPRSPIGLLTISGDDARWPSVRPEHDAVFSSIQTAAREDRIDFVEAFLRMRETRTFVVVDEAHHASAPGYYRLLSELRRLGAPLLGLTATPVRMADDDEKRLHALFDGHVIHQVSRRALIDQGVLAVPVFETIHTRVDAERDFTPDETKHLERHGDLAPTVLSRLAAHAPRNTLIVQHYRQNAARYGPTILFAADTLHARTLAMELRAAGVDADHVDHTRADAQAVIDRYQAKAGPQVLVNVEMLTEGFDAPHTRTVIVARPTASEGLLAQMVGRALRGPRSGGNDAAFLVTFVDTWSRFDVLDAEYVLTDELVPDPEPGTRAPAGAARAEIPPELVHEAYELVKGRVSADLVGVFQCLPAGWYAWEEMYDDDVRRRLVMVYDHQVEGWEALDRAYPTAARIGGPVSDDRAASLCDEYFGDLPDPLPRRVDVQAFLEARRAGSEIHRYTFEEKRSFDPVAIAQRILDLDLAPRAQRDHLVAVWEGSAACRRVYRSDLRAFQDEVTRALTDLVEPPPAPAPPEILRAVPPGPPRAWPAAEPGYSLVRVRDVVGESRRNFPGGPPDHGALVWSRAPLAGRWAFFRASDASITVSSALDSPDVPLFVLELLMVHLLLHAEMPGAGHDVDFRARERLFSPSSEAVEEARARGITAGASPGAWRALGEMFLDAFERRLGARRGRASAY
jgi:superfamily II DNA or RNA helicase